MPTKTKPLPAPAAKGLREPQSITRQLATFFDPMTLSAVHWRRVVAQAPVVGACVDTLIMQITGLNWAIEADDDALVEKYTLLLNMADNGGGFESLISRVAEDALTVPFGGAFELGSYPDGEVAWIAHLDAGLLGPTYDEKYPYRQTNPYDALHPKVFAGNEVSRVIWRPQTDIALYGWTKTPCMGCLPAIQGLLRSDRFWQTLLTDSPPAGILDIPGMSDQEARDWLDGWKTMMAGIDALKVPILTGEGRSDAKGTAQFISFGQDATQVQLPELVKRYSEQVCAVFGMNVADLGLFGQELRLAGATKIIELSKRQGLARLLKQFERAVNNDVLPEGVTFKWEDVELEDTVRKAAAKNQTATALATLTTAGSITPNIALAQAIADGIITVEVPEELLNPPEAPLPAPAQAPPVAQEGPPKSDAGTTTSGDTKGEQAAARASPKAGAPLGRGDSTRRIPPRTFPANTPAGRNLVRVLGPAIRGVTNSFTKGRLGDLYDAALNAYTKALPAERDIATPDEAANHAIDRLLAKADWWKTPNIEGKVVDALAQGYGDALHESAEEIQGALYHAGVASSAQVGFAAQSVADPNTLAEITVWGGDMIRNVDDGTKFYVKQKVLTGVKEGLGSPAIARTILVDGIRRGVVETFRGRTLSIVNTEMNKAMSQATLMQQQRVGLTKKVWHCVPALACDICAGNADQGPVPQDFVYEDVFDSGCTAPPAHPNVCNCWISFDQKELMDVAAPGGLPDYMTGAEEVTPTRLPQPSPTTAFGQAPEKWTKYTYKADFEARYGVVLNQTGEEQAWTLNKAQQVGRILETMPRCPGTVISQASGATQPPSIRLMTIQQIKATNPEAGAYYTPAHHRITLPTEFLGEGEGSRVEGTFSVHNAPTLWGDEIVAHEYGHALAQGMYGFTQPTLAASSGGYENMTRLAKIYEDKMAEVAADPRHDWLRAGFPSKYAMKNAGELLAESISYARVNPERFARVYPDLTAAIRHYFGFPPP